MFPPLRCPHPGLSGPPVDNLRKRRGRRGVALVMVLAFVVLLTGLVVAYFARTMTDRQLSNSSFNQAAADQLANSALAIITGDLKQEIVTSSSASTIDGVTIYTCTNNLNMVPERNGVPDTWSATGVANTTLLRISSTTAMPASGPGVDQQASNAPSTTLSANGRSISAARWNQHYLIPLQNTGANADTTPDKNFTPPSWVYVTGTGPAVLTAPSSSVIGRYAYAVYDEGALLDANVAGFPSTSGTLMPPQYVSKGSVAFADLTVLEQGKLAPQEAGINNLIAWRNYASMSDNGSQPSQTFPNLTFSTGTGLATNYKNLITSNTTGFLTVSGSTFSGLTDQAFMTRQELINLVLATPSANFSPNALQYLGTFSRAVAAPSWSPPADAATLGGTNGSLYAYNTNAESPMVSGSNNPNRDMANVRFLTSGSCAHWSDGVMSGSGTMLTAPASSSYAVNAGDPLLQSRFSLAKIAWLSQGDSSQGSALTSLPSPYPQAIQSCFGLKWGIVGTVNSANNGNPCWIYVGPTGATPVGRVETLDQVAAENPPREPNFFELLKAAILAGSIGLSPGPAAFDNGSNTADTCYHDFATPGPVESGCDGKYAYSYDLADTAPNPSRISDTQIIQIGANIIDQFDADSYPTAIYFKYPGIGKYDAGAGTPGNQIFGSTDMFYGDENLPDLLGMVVITATVDGLPKGAGTTDGGLSCGSNPIGTGTTAGLADWWQPLIWNMHQMPNSANSSVSPPKNYEVQGYGHTKLYWSNANPAGDGESNDQSFDTTGGVPIQWINFTDNTPTSSAFYAQPLLLTGTTVPNVVATTSIPQMSANSNMFAYSQNPFVGFWGGTDPHYGGGNQFCHVQAEGGSVTSFSMGWVDKLGGYHPYSFITGIFAFCYGVVNNNYGQGIIQPQGGCLPYDAAAEDHVACDPRTLQFSTTNNWEVNSTAVGTNLQCVPTYFPHVLQSGYYGGDTHGWGQPAAANFVYSQDPNMEFSGTIEDWEVNSKTPRTQTGADTNKGATYYTDPDGVIRPGDGVFGTQSTGDGMLLFSSAGTPKGTPIANGDNSSTGPTGTYDKGNSAHGRRPVILNRPFRSVGELGYTFRGEPFRSLDFFSQSSADAALLDVFSVNDQSRVIDGQLNSVVAGHVNLNDAPYPVIQAILSGGSKKDYDSTYNIAGTSTAQTLAEAIAKALNPSTGGTPLANRAGLVTQLGAVTKNGSGVIVNVLSGSPTIQDYSNKAYMEGPVRALSDVTNTRTWNLMIDVIAQSGSFSPSAPQSSSALNSAFNVQGERRYWLHVAIDRFTGKVVDQQLEPVYE